MKRTPYLAFVACVWLTSCATQEATRLPEPNSWAPITGRGNAVRVGMARQDVEKTLGKSTTGGNVSTYGPFGRAGQMYRVTFSNETVAEVKYSENPGDK